MDFGSSLLQILHFWFAYTQGRVYRKLCKYKRVRQKFTIQIERVFIRNLGNRKSDNTNLKHNNNNNVRGHGDPFSGPKKAWRRACVECWRAQASIYSCILYSRSYTHLLGLYMQWRRCVGWAAASDVVMVTEDGFGSWYRKLGVASLWQRCSAGSACSESVGVGRKWRCCK